MFRNYLAAALRNLARNRLMAALNIAGLAVGLAAALLTLLYLRHESSYDSFLPSAGRTHLLVSHLVLTGGQSELITDAAPFDFARRLAGDFPGLRVARLMPIAYGVRHGQTEATENVAAADPNLFDLLDLPVIAGDLAAALATPNSVVLTRRMARKYFGRDTPVGETLDIHRIFPMQVRAVLEDFPENTHLGVELFVSGLHAELGFAKWDAMPDDVDDFGAHAHTYLAPPPGVPAQPFMAAIERQLPDFLHRHRQPLLDSDKASIRLTLVPLSGLHLSPGNYSPMRPRANPSALAAVGLAGFLIIVIATINFVNLMTARSARRAVEVGVRKVSGAHRSHLMAQFLGESVLYAAVALLVALGLVEMALPAIDAGLVPGLLATAAQASALAILAPAALAVGLLGGVYPALVLAGFRPASVLKGERIRAPGTGTLRQALVVLQFGLLIALILASVVVARQTAFGLREGLRLAHDNVLLVTGQCRAPFVDGVRAIPGVEGAACAADGILQGRYSFQEAETGQGTRAMVGLGPVDFDFFRLFGIAAVAGRLFGREYGADVDATVRHDDPYRDPRPGRGPVILNESAVRKLGFSSPAAAVGGSVRVDHGPPSEIVGVVPDFSFDLVSRPIPPTAYFIWPSRMAAIHVKLRGSDLPETLDAIDTLWGRVGDPRPIPRQFFSQYLQDLYVNTIRQGRVIAGLAEIAIFIAALGLFGLASFTAERRTKEIGIRKAMGAGVGEILRLLLWQFARPVLWANLIAWPAAFFVMRRWLQGFAYHIDLAPWMFLTAGAAALLIALLTVAGHSLLVARTRPVLALRYE